MRSETEEKGKRRRKVLLEPPTEGRIALTAYFLPGLADWFLDVRRKRYLLSTRRRIQVLLTVHWAVCANEMTILIHFEHFHMPPMKIRSS